MKYPLPPRSWTHLITNSAQSGQNTLIQSWPPRNETAEYSGIYLKGKTICSSNHRQSSCIYHLSGNGLNIGLIRGSKPALPEGSSFTALKEQLELLIMETMDSASVETWRDLLRPRFTIVRGASVGMPHYKNLIYLNNSTPIIEMSYSKSRGITITR